jgi:hypothetical protein
VIDDVQQVEPEDEKIRESWQRLSDEPWIRGVSADAVDDLDSWLVTVWAQEHFRQEQLGVELRQRIQSALRGVPGVSGAQEHNNETWAVSGDPSGEALTRAAAGVVDEFADRLRVAYDEMY